MTIAKEIENRFSGSMRDEEGTHIEDTLEALSDTKTTTEDYFSVKYYFSDGSAYVLCEAGHGEAFGDTLCHCWVNCHWSGCDEAE